MAKTQFVTPKGRAKYPWLNKADTQFSAEGVYSTYLIMDPKEAAELKQLIKKTAEAEFGEKAKYSVPLEINDETGELELKCKSNFQPKFVDSAGQPIPPQSLPALYSGSILRVGGEIKPYTVQGKKGVSMRLGYVQIIEPVGSSGGSSPFDAVEGGFVAPAEMDIPKGGTDDGGSDDDDFDF